MKTKRANFKFTTSQAATPLPVGRLARKPRPGASFTSRLTEAQRETLFGWLARDNMSYAVALARLAQEFGLVASPYKLSAFWQNYCSPRLLRPPVVGNLTALEITLHLPGYRPVKVQLQPEGPTA